MSATQQAERLATYKRRCVELKKAEEDLLRESSQIESGESDLQKDVDASAERLAALEAEASVHSRRRRKLRNTISVLKGCARVYCRVLPTGNDSGENGSVTIEPATITTESIMLSAPSDAAAVKCAKHTFAFETVFPAQSTDEQVFDNVCDLVDCALAGDNVAVVSLSSSKSADITVCIASHSLSTLRNFDSYAVQGLVHNSLHYIFNQITELHAKGVTTKVSAAASV